MLGRRGRGDKDMEEDKEANMQADKEADKEADICRPQGWKGRSERRAPSVARISERQAAGVRRASPMGEGTRWTGTGRREGRE